MAVPTREEFFETWKLQNPQAATYNDGASVGKANYGTFTSGISLASPGFRDWQLPGKHPSLKTNQDKFETDYKIFANRAESESKIASLQAKYDEELSRNRLRG